MLNAFKRVFAAAGLGFGLATGAIAQQPQQPQQTAETRDSVSAVEVNAEIIAAENEFRRNPPSLVAGRDHLRNAIRYAERLLARHPGETVTIMAFKAGLEAYLAIVNLAIQVQHPTMIFMQNLSTVDTLSRQHADNALTLNLALAGLVDRLRELANDETLRDIIPVRALRLQYVLREVERVIERYEEELEGPVAERDQSMLRLQASLLRELKNTLARALRELQRFNDRENLPRLPARLITVSTPTTTFTMQAEPRLPPNPDSVALDTIMRVENDHYTDHFRKLEGYWMHRDVLPIIAQLAQLRAGSERRGDGSIVMLGQATATRQIYLELYAELARSSERWTGVSGGKFILRLAAQRALEDERERQRVHSRLSRRK